jgi:hypothetical protein
LHKFSTPDIPVPLFALQKSSIMVYALNTRSIHMQLSVYV